MKRRVTLKLVVAVILLTASACLLLTGCGLWDYLFVGTATEHEILSKGLGMDLSEAEIRTYEDTHGGFHGDGETYAELIFSNDAFCSAIENDARWKKLPLTPTLDVVVYGGMLTNGESWSSFIKDDDGNLLVPTVTEGYYYFYDRSAESKDPTDDSEILDRYSVNFTLAIYDAETNTLYYYEIDT